MELCQLKYVLSVVKYKNFTRAAENNFVTSSSLSQQIKKLEEELGVVLFGRTTRSVHLTLAGIEFVEIAKKIMMNINEINAAMQKYIDGENGQLSIGCTPALKVFGITHLIGDFQRTYPKITLNFYEAECFDLYQPLYKEKIDVAFLTAFDKYKQEKGKMSLEAIPLVKDEVVIATSLSHPFACKKVIDLKEAAQENFVYFTKSTGLYYDALEGCHRAGFEPNLCYEVKYVDTCLGLVAEGLGIAMLSSRSVTNTLWKNVAIVHLKDPIIRTLYLVVPKKPNLQSVILNFKSFFSQWAQANADDVCIAK